MFKIKFKTFCGKKIIVCFNGLKGAPLNALKLFPTKCFFFVFFVNYYEKSIWYKIHVFVPQKYSFNKKKIVDHKVFKLQRFSKVLPNVGGGVINPKNLLKP